MSVNQQWSRAIQEIAALPQSDYPEHKKLAKVQDKSQAIGEFIEWLSDNEGIHLASYTRDHSRDFLAINHTPIKKLLADFFKIDLQVLEAEKKAMIEELNRG